MLLKHSRLPKSSVLGLGLIIWAAAGTTASASPLAGTWKLVIMPAGQELSLLVMDIRSKDDGLESSIVAVGAPHMKDARVGKLSTSASGGVELRIKAGGNTFRIRCHLPADEQAPAHLYGHLTIRGNRDLVRLERTMARELDPASSMSQSPQLIEFAQAVRTKEPADKLSQLKSLLSKTSEPALQLRAGLEALDANINAGGTEAESSALVEQMEKAVLPFGPEMKLYVWEQSARLLAASKPQVKLAHELAHKASKALDRETDLELQVAVLKALRNCTLKKDPKANVKDLDGRLAEIELRLDEEYARSSISFNLTKYTPRRNRGDRVAVVELFTGAQCPPCVAADIAFDALLKSFTASEVVLLQYHIHVPAPDPLTNEAGERRSSFYGVQSAPTVLINGKAGPQVGGFTEHAQDRYEAIFNQLAEELERKSMGQLTLSVERKDDEIQIQASVSGLKATGEDIRLRFVLVEDVVRYPGRNGQRLHHHVVRAFPGGAEGFAMPRKAGKYSASIRLTEVAASINKYLDDSAKKMRFPDGERPLELKSLKVLALIQNDRGLEILQAAQANVPAAK